MDPAPPDPDLRFAGDALAVSPDGALIATAESDDRVRLGEADSFGTMIWDFASGAVRTRFEDGRAGLLAWHPQGGAIAIGIGAQIVLTDLEGRVHWYLTGHADPGLPTGARFSALRFNPDGTQLVSVHTDRTVRLWSASADECEPVRTLSVTNLEPRSAAFSPDGRTLAIGGEGGPIQLWDAADGTLRGTADGLGTTGVSQLEYTDASTLVAASEAGFEVRALRANGSSIALPLDGNRPDAIAVSANERVAVAAGGRPELTVWDLGSGARETLPAAPGKVTALSWTPDGAALVGVSPRAGIVIWDGAHWRDAKAV